MSRLRPLIPRSNIQTYAEYRQTNKFQGNQMLNVENKYFLLSHRSIVEEKLRFKYCNCLFKRSGWA